MKLLLRPAVHYADQRADSTRLVIPPGANVACLQLAQINGCIQVAGRKIDERIGAIAVTSRLDTLPAPPGIAYDHRLVRNAAEKGTRLDQCPQVLHLPPGGTLHRVDPVAIHMIHASIARIRKTPDRMMSVCDSAGVRKDRAKDLLADIDIAKISGRWIPVRPRIVGMILIIWLQIEGWLGRRRRVVTCNPLDRK